PPPEKIAGFEPGGWNPEDEPELRRREPEGPREIERRHVNDRADRQRPERIARDETPEPALPHVRKDHSLRRPAPVRKGGRIDRAQPDEQPEQRQRRRDQERHPPAEMDRHRRQENRREDRSERRAAVRERDAAGLLVGRQRVERGPEAARK